jgi:hypothetical protein
MRHLLSGAALLCASALPAAADEFTDVIDSALSAYAEGDITIASEELDYAMKLLGQMKSASLAGYLPDAPAGWTREEAEADGSGLAMSMFGGGTAAAATYRKSDAEMTVTLLANSPMVSSIGAMITGVAAMGGGKPIRIQRTQFSDNDGELQGVIDSKVMVSVSGNASLEDKQALLEAMDFKALRDF